MDCKLPTQISQYYVNMGYAMIPESRWKRKRKLGGGLQRRTVMFAGKSGSLQPRICYIYFQ
jgi:hypothetical protein